ncbi:MAG: PAS domain S-box protein [Phycisphaeraceae bacterium]|nr:PAS domain S-box protein [Phycisphaeraceae bacterium]
MAAIYLAASVAWILLSDLTVMWLHLTREQSLKVEAIKGVGFVALSAILLFALLRLMLRRVDASQAALADSEQKFRQVAEAATGVFWVLDLEPGRRVVYVNPAFERIWGIKVEELYRNPSLWHGCVHPEDRDRVTGLIERSAGGKTGTEFNVEYRIIRPDGAVRWISDRGVRVARLNGMAMRVVGVAEDVTERRESERALHRSEERLRDAMAAAKMISWDWNFVENRGEFSDDPGAFHGLPPGGDYSARDRALELVHPDDRQRVLDTMLEAVAAGSDYSAEFRGPDGRWFASRGRAVRDDSGRVVRMMGVTLDITARKRSDMAMRQLVQGTTATGQRFFNEAVRALAQALGVRWAYAGEVSSDCTRVHLLAAWEDGKLQRPFSYDIEGTPCQQLLSGSLKFYRRGVTREFPQDQVLVKMGAEAYLGIPLVSAEGVTLGVLSAMNDRPLDESTQPEAVLQIMASRAASELDRLRAERAVTRSEERYRLVTKATSDAVWDWDPVRDTLLWGEGVETLFGFSREQLGTRLEGWTQRVHESDRARVEASLRSALERGESRWVEQYRFLRASGAYAVVLDRGHIIRDADGKAIRIIGAMADITEQHEAEQKLKRSEATTRALLEAVPDLMFRMDRDGRYLDCHAPDPTDLALPRERFVGKLCTEVLPKKRAEECMGAIRRLLETGRPQTYEYEGERKNGRSRWWEVRAVACGADEVMLLVRDISPEKHAVKALSESQQRLSGLVRSAPLGVIAWAPDFTIAEWNPAAEAIFGWTAEEAIGKHASMLIPQPIKPQIDQLWRHLMAGTGGERSRNENLTKSGARIMCEWYNSRIVDADGHSTGVASLVQDVTAQEAHERQRSLMMAELDHRVKNNLAAVLALAEQSVRGSQTIGEFSETFLGRLRAMARMHTVLAMGKWEIAPLTQLVRQSLEAFLITGAHAGSNPQRIFFDGPEVELQSRAASPVAMALHELATNAVKYGALSVPEGRVEVTWTVEPQPDGVNLLILRWQERGGPAVTPPARRGFGTELIQGGIAYELHGTVTLDFPPEGVCCIMKLPLERKAPSPEP